MAEAIQVMRSRSGQIGVGLRPKLSRLPTPTTQLLTFSVRQLHRDFTIDGARERRSNLEANLAVTENFLPPRPRIATFREISGRSITKIETLNHSKLFEQQRNIDRFWS